MLVTWNFLIQNSYHQIVRLGVMWPGGTHIQLLTSS